MPRASLRRATAVFFAALCGAAFYSLPLFAAPKARPISIKSFTSPCEIKRADAPGKWFAARVGEDLKVGDALRTGAGGNALLLMSDGSRMLLGATSRLKVEAVAPNRIFGLDTGKVKAFIKKLQGGDKFEVKTPLASASVRGTVFEVGFDERKKAGYLAVDEGTVALAKDGKEIFVREGERVGYDAGRLPDVPRGSDAGGVDREDIRREVGLGMSKEDVMAAAAEEMRLAEYQEGKVMTDVFGNRVRLEEYIIRRPKESALPDNSFKLVVLNDRDSRFDYFYYRGEFNAPLPQDLSAAFRQMNGVLGSRPAYYLSSYEMGMSNTQDYVKDNASGGHLVKATFDGTNYVLTDGSDPSRTRTVPLDQGPITVVDNGVTTTYEKVYDPVKDQTVNLTQSQFAAGDYGTAVYDASNDTFHALGTTDTFWRTSFNNYAHVLDGINKQSYSALSNTLVLDVDATFTFAGGTMAGVTDTPAGSDMLHNRTRLYYGDSTTETYDTYIIDDQGKVGGVSNFAGLTTGTGFKAELLKWNYEQVITATEFQGRKIDLVVEPKILIKSGIIK